MLVLYLLWLSIDTLISYRYFGKFYVQNFAATMLYNLAQYGLLKERFSVNSVHHIVNQ